MEVLFRVLCLSSARTKSTTVFCRNLPYSELWCGTAVERLVVLVILPQISSFCTVIILALRAQNNALSLCGLVANFEHMWSRNTLLSGWENEDDMAICSGWLMGWQKWGMRRQVRPRGCQDRSHLPKRDSFAGGLLCNMAVRACMASVSATWVGEYGERYGRSH